MYLKLRIMKITLNAIFLCSLLFLLEFRGTVLTLIYPERNQLQQRFLGRYGEGYNKDNWNNLPSIRYRTSFLEKLPYFLKPRDNHEENWQATASPDITDSALISKANPWEINFLFNKTKLSYAGSKSPTFWKNQKQYFTGNTKTTQPQSDAFWSYTKSDYLVPKSSRDHYFTDGINRSDTPNYKYWPYAAPYFFRSSKNPYFTKGNTEYHFSSYPTYRCWLYTASYYTRTSEIPYFTDGNKGYQPSIYSNYRYWPYTTSYYPRPSRSPYFTDRNKGYQPSIYPNYRYWPYTTSYYPKPSESPYFTDGNKGYQPSIYPNYRYWPYTTSYYPKPSESPYFTDENKGYQSSIYPNYRYWPYTTSYYPRRSRSPYFTYAEKGYQSSSYPNYRYWVCTTSYYTKPSRSPYFTDDTKRSTSYNYRYWPYTSYYQRSSKNPYDMEKSYSSNFRLWSYSGSRYPSFRTIGLFRGATGSYYFFPPTGSPTLRPYTNKNYNWHGTERPFIHYKGGFTDKSNIKISAELLNNTRIIRESKTPAPLKIFVIFDYTLFEVIKLLSFVEKICAVTIIGLILSFLIVCLKRRRQNIKVFTMKKDDIEEDEEKLLIV